MFLRVYRARVGAIEALQRALLDHNDSAALFDAADAFRLELESLGGTKAGRSYRLFSRLLEAVCHLYRWSAAVRSAQLDSERHVRAAKQAAKDLLRELSADHEIGKLSSVASRIEAITELEEIPSAVELLIDTPLPLPLFPDTRPTGTHARRLPPSPVRREHPVAFLSFALNGAAFGDPQPIIPESLHDLQVEVRLSDWPEKATELILDAISVEPLLAYELPRFSFRRPQGVPPFTLKTVGRMLLHVPQALLSRPLEFSYRAWFVPEGLDVRVTAEGHTHLRVESFDPDRTPLTGYREIDRRLLAIRTEARMIPGTTDNALGDFLRILTPIARIAGQAIQDSLFPRPLSEREFHSEIKKLIRADPQIASELEEHPHAAGGVTDLSFRAIRIELKSVPDRTLTLNNVGEFLGQTAQYVAGSDRRFGILCVLDCSPKDLAPGSPANDIGLRIIPPPDGAGEIPIVLAAIIIRGNLSVPSRL